MFLLVCRYAQVVIDIDMVVIELIPDRSAGHPGDVSAFEDTELAIVRLCRAATHEGNRFANHGNVSPAIIVHIGYDRKFIKCYAAYGRFPPVALGIYARREGRRAAIQDAQVTLVTIHDFLKAITIEVKNRAPGIAGIIGVGLVPPVRDGRCRSGFVEVDAGELIDATYKYLRVVFGVPRFFIIIHIGNRLYASKTTPNARQSEVSNQAIFIPDVHTSWRASSALSRSAYDHIRNTIQVNVCNRSTAILIDKGRLHGIQILNGFYLIAVSIQQIYVNGIDDITRHQF